MAHTCSNLLYHLVWSTKNREPFIKNEIKPRLNSYTRKVIEGEGAKLLFMNGVEDHVHLLVATPLTVNIPDLLEKTKPVTTKWLNKTYSEFNGQFSWQKGYGAFTVAKSILQGVINYIATQEEHHKVESYKEGYIRFLEEQGISYDPRFIFD